MPGIIPTIIERWNQGAAASYDIYSRLLRDRIIFVGGYEGAVTTDSANILIAQLLYLESEDNDKDINLYINSPGGMVTAGLAVYDTMQYIKAPITTICIGMAMSFGAVLLAAGSKGRRFALPQSRVMTIGSPAVVASVAHPARLRHQGSPGQARLPPRSRRPCLLRQALPARRCRTALLQVFLQGLSFTPGMEACSTV